MPRLGDDPNVANAYPERGHPNLRGGWVCHVTTRLLGGLFLLLLMNNLLRKDYKSDTKNYMRSKGMDESEIDKIIPKTTGEKRRDMILAKKSAMEKEQYFLDEIGTLTKAIIELQAALVEQTGKELEHQIYLPSEEEEKDADGNPIVGVTEDAGNGLTKSVDADGNGEGGDAGAVHSSGGDVDLVEDVNGGGGGGGRRRWLLRGWNRLEAKASRLQEQVEKQWQHAKGTEEREEMDAEMKRGPATP